MQNIAPHNNLFTPKFRGRLQHLSMYFNELSVNTQKSFLRHPQSMSITKYHYLARRQIPRPSLFITVASSKPLNFIFMLLKLFNLILSYRNGSFFIFCQKYRDHTLLQIMSNYSTNKFTFTRHSWRHPSQISFTNVLSNFSTVTYPSTLLLTTPAPAPVPLPTLLSYQVRVSSRS